VPIVILLALLLAVSGADAAETLTLSTHPRGALFELKGPVTIRGASPLPLLPDQQGDYRVRVELAGHETAFGAIALRRGPNELRVVRSGGLARERLFRSLAFPGAGQIGEGRAFEGIFWGTAAAGAGVTTMVLEAHYREARENHKTAEGALLALVEQTETAPASGAYLGLLHEAFRREAIATRRLRDRNYALGAVGVCWGLNLLDAALFHAPFRVKEGAGGVVEVELAEKNRARRVFRSALFPGLGQSYAGRKARGAVYAIAATAAATTALVCHLDYRGELDRVDALDRELAALAPGGPAEASFSKIVVAERETALRRSEDEQERRNIAVAATAAVYAVSILDAAFTSGPPVAAEGLTVGLATPVSGDQVGFGVRVRF